MIITQRAKNINIFLYCMIYKSNGGWPAKHYTNFLGTEYLSAVYKLLIYIFTCATLSLQETIRSEDIKYASCCVAFAPSTPGTCRFCALYLAQILCLLTLETSNGENFFIFKADEESVPGSTLIEDNAENEEIIPF